jgi:hypothetical protein
MKEINPLDESSAGCTACAERSIKKRARRPIRRMVRATFSGLSLLADVLLCYKQKIVRFPIVSELPGRRRLVRPATIRVFPAHPGEDRP